MSYDEDIRQLEYQEVVRLFRNTADVFLKIQIEGEAKPIIVTLGHPFYVNRTRNNLSANADDDQADWVLSKSLKVGDLLRLTTGEWKPIRSIERVAEAQTTYNFEVAKNHNYFVGENGWLVHNQSLKTVGSGGGRMTPDQQALKELVEEATNGARKPLSVDNAETVLDWADEVGYPGVRAKPADVSSLSNWNIPGNPPHIHIPGVGSGHVPVKPGVTPR